MPDIMETIKARHSVRAYTDQPIDAAARAKLEELIATCNAEGDLSIALVCDEPKAFSSALARYGKFTNVSDYLVLAGRDAPDLAERCGYYGERIVLAAQEMGLNTCWVALTFKKRYVKRLVAPGDKLVVVIAIGHGANAGSPHKSKYASDVVRDQSADGAPDWFDRGVEAALLAPTALNQQKFEITFTHELDSEGKPVVALESRGGPYSDVDLGIVRLHFELVAGTENFVWENPL